MQIFDVFGDITLNDNNAESRLLRLNNVIDNARDRMLNLSNAMANIGGGLMNIGSSITQNFTMPIINAVKDSITTASDLNEAYNVVDTTFGKSSNEVKDWSKNLMDSFGLVQLEAINYVGSMGAMLKSSGFTSKASKDMSKSLVELTGDMSSFYNLGHEETWEKIRAGISGETEPLKSLGINMSVANLEAFALKEGIKKSWKEMSQAEQVTLRYNYLMSVTKDVQGDFAKTSDSLSNRIRILGGRFTEMKTNLGNELLPYVNKAVEILLKLVDRFVKLPEPIKKVILIVGGLFAAIGPVITVMGGLIVAGGAVVGAISAIGAPVIAVVAGLGILVGGFVAAGVAIVAMLEKVGILQNAFEFINGIVLGLSKALSGDLTDANMILQSTLGVSCEGAQNFINHLVDAKKSVMKLKPMIQDIANVIMTIFTGDTDKMIKLLISKFGYSKDEAKKFADKVKSLRDKVAQFAEKVKKGVIAALIGFITTIKKASKFVYDHRKQIMQAIEKIVSFGSKSVNAINKTIIVLKNLIVKLINAKDTIIKFVNSAKAKFDSLKSKVTSVFDSLKSKVDKVKNSFNSLLNKVSSVINKIKNIKFPSVPSWVPGFAEGVRNFGGGLALVGEKGPEIVRLPKGADVIPNNEVKNTITGSQPFKKIINTRQVGGNYNNYNLTMYNQIAQRIDINKFMDEVMNRLKMKGRSINNG